MLRGAEQGRLGFCAADEHCFPRFPIPVAARLADGADERTPTRPIPEPPSGGPVTANPKRNYLSIMGDVVGKPVEEVDVAETADAPDPADKVAKIEPFEDGEVVATNEPASPGKAEWQVKR